MQATQAIQATSGLRAGFARRDITPKQPCFLCGYPHVERIWTGVHDPLYASAVCLENQGMAVLLISLDLLFVTTDWARECRERISQATGIPPAHILIGATHTHSGPHTAEILAWKDDPVVPSVDAEYLEFVLTETTAAAVEAWEGRVRAEAAWTTADVRGLAGSNRIDPQGPEDPEAGLLFVRKAEGGSPVAVLSVYGMHPTVLHEDSKLVSSDFIAFTRQAIEETFPGVGVVYLNGVCGNQSPRRVVRATTFAEAERIGRALGERMAETLRQAERFESHFPLAAGITTITLQGKVFPPVAEAAAALEAARNRFHTLRDQGAPAAEVRTAECTVFGAEEVLTLAEAEQTGEAEAVRQRYRQTEVQVLRLGSAFVAGWPGEFFVEYGLEAKRRSKEPLFISTITNGELHGYIVTPEAERARGYEAQMSLFPAETAQKFIGATLDLIEKLKPTA